MSAARDTQSAVLECRDKRGFRDNAFLESVLHNPHEVCLLLQKDEGVGLSMAWQLLRAVHSAAVAPKLPVVSGPTKDGETRTMVDLEPEVRPNPYLPPVNGYGIRSLC